ncbi:hypothetical protein ACWDCC_20560 [Streptomyces sp. NPDC001102]
MKTAAIQDQLRPHRTAKEAAERAETIRLTITAAIGTIITVVFLGWLWSTIAPIYPVLAPFVEDSIITTHNAIGEQAQRFSGDH